MLEDSRLIWRCKQGDTKALGQIYLKYKDNLLNVALALVRDHSAAEDIVHEVFVAFTESVHSFTLIGNLKAYLAVCVANKARDRLRRKHRQFEALDQQNSPAHADLRPDTQAQHQEMVDTIRSALQTLPYEQREVISLRVYGNLTFRKIAVAQNVSINTAFGRYRYGLDKLKTRLNGELDHENR